MSVLFETSHGDIVIDLYVAKCPRITHNFLKLCKIKYYNNALFYTVQKDYLTNIQHKSKKATTINEILYGEQAKYLEDEIDLEKKHNKMGLVSTANLGPHLNNSDFFITLSDRSLDTLNGKHTIFGEIAEGLNVLKKINESYIDKENRPLINIRIYHTLLLEDPFPDPPTLSLPEGSPEPILADDERLEVQQAKHLLEGSNRTEEEIIEETKALKAKTKAVVLEMLNDLPDADIKPPDNVLFVCKLNPITQERDLELIFSRFGAIRNCDIVRDWKTGQSLQYAFIEFETTAACEEAVLKMDNALIDERRIHVNFSQSVAKSWHKYRYDKTHKGKAEEGKEQGANVTDRVVLKNKFTGKNPGKYGMVFDQGSKRRPSSPSKEIKATDEQRKGARVGDRDDHSKQQVQPSIRNDPGRHDHKNSKGDKRPPERRRSRSREKSREGKSKSNRRKHDSSKREKSSRDSHRRKSPSSSSQQHSRKHRNKKKSVSRSSSKSRSSSSSLSRSSGSNS